MMGQAHGLGQSIVALSRTFAPIAAGAIFAWSVEVPHSVSDDDMVVCVLFFPCAHISSIVCLNSFRSTRSCCLLLPLPCV